MTATRICMSTLCIFIKKVEEKLNFKVSWFSMVSSTSFKFCYFNDKSDLCLFLNLGISSEYFLFFKK